MLGELTRRFKFRIVLPMDHAVSPPKRRTSASERWRQIAVMAAMIAGLSAGLVAARNIKIVQSRAEPAIMPSDDEIYTGSILFVPDDETPRLESLKASVLAEAIFL